MWVFINKSSPKDGIALDSKSVEDNNQAIKCEIQMHIQQLVTAERTTTTTIHQGGAAASALSSIVRKHNNNNNNLQGFRTLQSNSSRSSHPPRTLI